jgi:sugar phosphate isomerase/epimerase
MIGTTSIGLSQDFSDALRRAPEFDIDFLEITCEYPHCHPETVSVEERNEILDFAEENNLSLSVHSTFSDINLTHINPGLMRESVRETEECIRFASDIKAKCIVIHPGKIPEIACSLPHDALVRFGIEDVRSFFHSLSKTILSSLRRDVKICVENMHESFSLCRTSKEHLSVLNGVRACFDVGHAHIVSDAASHAQRLARNIDYVHVHDNRGGSDEHLSLGEGNAPWREVVGILGEKMYCIEPQFLHETSARKSIAILRQITS